MQIKPSRPIEFKEIVYIAGSKYEIRDINVWRHYRQAKKLIVSHKQIIGFKHI
jgi:hypothetical protein